MAAAKRALRTVKPNEKPKRPKPLTLREAVETGDYRTILVAQRREIALSIPEEHGPAKAALHRQLSLIAKELESLDASTREGGADLEPASDAEWEAI